MKSNPNPGDRLTRTPTFATGITVVHTEYYFSSFKNVPFNSTVQCHSMNYYVLNYYAAYRTHIAQLK